MSSPDKTFIFVNNRPVHHKDIMKVKSFWLKKHLYNEYFFFVSYTIVFFYVSLQTSSWLDCVMDHQLLRQHYNAQYPDNRNRYPVLMLKIAVSPSSVDVNLTPDKTQVLLHNKVAVKLKLDQFNTCFFLFVLFVVLVTI